jgi:hypothetical protein
MEMESFAGLLDFTLRSAGIPIAGVGWLPDGALRIDYLPEVTEAQRRQAGQIAARFDPAAQDEAKKKKRRAGAVQHLAGADGQTMMLRGLMRAVYQSLAEVRAKVGLPVRTWAEMLTAIRQDIEAGNCD